MSVKPKENFRLLDLSSDEESEDLQLEIFPRKKKVTRRERNRRPTTPVHEVNISNEIQCALRWAVRGTLILWLVTLTWLCVSLYDQVSGMRADIVKVSTSSDGVGDTLQGYHTAMKELHANTSDLSARLAKLEKEHMELAKRVENESGRLAAVADQLAAAPSLADTPRRLAELQRTVANFGSQISGFDSNLLQSAHKQAAAATAGLEEVRNTIHELDARANDTLANVSANAKQLDDVGNALTTLNTTLSGRVDALSTRLDDATRTSTVAPSTPSTTVSAPPPAAPAAAPAAPVAAPAAPAPAAPAPAAPAPPSVDATAGTSTTTQGLPAKPSVLQ